MFSHQQLQQQLLQLQHLLQHQPQPQQQQPQPPQQQASRCVTPSQQQQQQMLNLRATSQASLLNANPMLQRALLIQQMQGNLRSFNMAAAPVLQQFFPQATRHSLLGPPPVGVSLKPTRLCFHGGLPFQRQNRTFRKDFLRTSERKREVDPATSSSQGQGADESLTMLDMSVTKEQPNSPPPENLAESSSAGEPPAKQLRREAEDTIPEEAVCLRQVEESSAEPHLEDSLVEEDNGKENMAADTSKEKNIAGELKTSEVVSSAGSLKVTIQQSSENRAISTTALKPAFWTSEMGTAEGSPKAALKFYCYICKTNCYNQQNFQAHMAGAQHQQQLREIQHMSNICFVSLLPVAKEQKPLAEKDGHWSECELMPPCRSMGCSCSCRESQQRWCNTCQGHFTGDLIKHRRTQEHKLAKRSLRPFCMVCSRHFKTPRKFVEHMKSPEHKQKAKEVKLGEKEQEDSEEPGDSEELITVDAVGCFEDDEEDEEEEEEEEEQGKAGEEGASEVGQLHKEERLIKQKAALDDSGGSEEYRPDTIYGLDFLVPVVGFLCRLCHKFCPSDSAAQIAHCKSLMHFENLQRYKAMRLQPATAFVDTPIHPQQGLSDLQVSSPPPPPAAAAAATDKSDGTTEAPSEGKQTTALTEACQTSREEAPDAAQRPSPEAVGTDDACGALPITEEGGDGRAICQLLAIAPWGERPLQL